MTAGSAARRPESLLQHLAAVAEAERVATVVGSAGVVQCMSPKLTWKVLCFFERKQCHNYCFCTTISSFSFGFGKKTSVKQNIK